MQCLNKYIANHITHIPEENVPELLKVSYTTPHFCVASSEHLKESDDFIGNK